MRRSDLVLDLAHRMLLAGPVRSRTLANMHRPTVGGWRLTRAGALTASALVLSCAAHVLGGGQAPPFVTVVALGALGFLAAVLLAGRRCGPVTIGAALAISQVLLHETFMLISLPVACGPVPSGAAMAHTMHCTSSVMSGASGPQHMVPTLAMVAWHALATVVIAAGLAFGERVVWQLAQWVLQPPPRLVRLAAPVLLSPLQAVDHPAALGQPWLRSVSRRGPPLGAAANAS